MAVFPIHYCGSIGYYQALCNAEKIEFELHEHFVKQTHRNRMEILGPNGIHKLSIPTVKTGSRKPMKDVRISHVENWKKEHWKSLEAAYRRSPYFEFYEDNLTRFYNSKWEHLIVFNLDFFNTILQFLEIDLEYSTTNKFEKEVDQDYRNKHIEAAAYEPYLQVFSDRHKFIKNLSILDALFNLGPRTRDIILPE